MDGTGPFTMEQTTEKTQLRIAIQKSGRLSEDSLRLLSDCGLKLQSGLGKLKAPVANFPAEVLFLRDDDIPGYVADGVADIGLVGENVVAECALAVEIVHRLGFGKCRLSIAVPKGLPYNSIHDLEGQRIATSYTKIVGDYLAQHGVNADLHSISGSVEIAPSIGLAQAVCDIVSSGSTLLANGLVEVETIFRSEAVMIAAPQLSAEKQQLLDQLLFRITAVQKAANTKYILLNVPNEAIERVTSLLPGINSPTIMPLVKPGWSSLHSVIDENAFWPLIEQLKAAGAEGILVSPIEKIIS